MQQKLHLDFARRCYLGARMDKDDTDLVIALCTRIGTCMEDASGIALGMCRLDGHARTDALQELEAAVQQIDGLFRAARVLTV